VYFSDAWHQHQTFKDCLCCHICHTQLGTSWNAIVEAFCAFSNTKPTKTMAKIELCGGWGPRPSASATHGQTGCGQHQRGGSNDACATPQRWLRHELPPQFLERTASEMDLVEATVGQAAEIIVGGGPPRPSNYPSHIKEIISRSLPWQGSFCTVAWARMHGCMCMFCRECGMHSDRCSEHHACASVCVK